MNLDGWCCTQCEKNFYLPAGSVNELLSTISCPYCGQIEYTVHNTIKE